MNRNTTPISRGRLSLQLVVGLLAGVVLGGTILSTGLAQQQQDLDKLNRFVQTQNLPAANLFREGRDLVGDAEWNQAVG